MPLRRRSRGHARVVGEVEINYQGIHQMLFYPEIRANLKARADRVADTARQHPSVTSNAVNVVVEEGNPNQGNRPHVWVKMDDPAGRGIEARHRVLGSAIDSARD